MLHDHLSFIDHLTWLSFIVFHQPTLWPNWQLFIDNMNKNGRSHGVDGHRCSPYLCSSQIKLDEHGLKTLNQIDEQKMATRFLTKNIVNIFCLSTTWLRLRSVRLPTLPHYVTKSDSTCRSDTWVCCLTRFSKQIHFPNSELYFKFWELSENRTFFSI